MERQEEFKKVGGRKRRKRDQLRVLLTFLRIGRQETPGGNQTSTMIKSVNHRTGRAGDKSSGGKDDERKVDSGSRSCKGRNKELSAKCQWHVQQYD